MGQAAQKMSKGDHKELIDILNVAYAEEWLAYYQYWIGAKLAHGPRRESITAEFEKHAGEELKHAGWIADRIIQLGGTPIIDPNEFSKVAKCKYLPPRDSFILKLVEQNLDGERCAISRYQQICEMTAGKDYVTFNLSRKIMKEEEEHEQDMEDYHLDITSASDFYKK